MRLQSLAKRTVISAIAALLILEIGARLAGVTDFPTYAVDDGIGYVVKPNQAGKFLRRNAWEYNDRSMGVAKRWTSGPKPNVLLIGNSIVSGGNPYTQSEKVGPLLQRQVGDGVSVWPVAVGGWTNVNETVYLERNPDVVASTSLFVWEYMPGGLSQLSPWRGDYVFPRQRPVFAAWYAWNRYLLPRLIPRGFNDLPPTGDAVSNNMKRFEAMLERLCDASHRSVPGILLLYPGSADLAAARQGRQWLPERDLLERIAAKLDIRIVDLTQRPEWQAELYRDGVHPTAEGNLVLARLLAQEINAVMKL